MATADEIRAALCRQHPDAFDQGVRDGMTLEFDGPRERGGYPRGFHQWQPARRDAYYAGYSVGRTKRLRETPDTTPDEGSNPFLAYADAARRRK
jgi:hypothetical protein